MDDERDELRAAESAYSAFASGDFAALLDAFSETAIWDATDALWAKGIFFGHDGIKEYFGKLGELWAELRLEDYEVESVRPGLMIARGRLRGTDRASGESADAPFLHWLEVGPDGKVTRLRILVDPDRDAR